MPTAALCSLGSPACCEGAPLPPTVLSHGSNLLASSVCPLMDEDKRLVHSSDGRDRLWGKLGLALVGRPHSGRGHALLVPCLTEVLFKNPVLQTMATTLAEAVLSFSVWPCARVSQS